MVGDIDWRIKRGKDKAKLARMNKAFGSAQQRMMEMYSWEPEKNPKTQDLTSTGKYNEGKKK